MVENSVIIALAVGAAVLGLSLLVGGGVLAYLTGTIDKDKYRRWVSILGPVAGILICVLVTGMGIWLVGNSGLLRLGSDKTEVADSAQIPATEIPTPVLLLSGTPRSYLPSQTQMPQGYTLEPHMSPSLSEEQASVGYTNIANALSAQGDAVGVQFTVFILETEDLAHLLFENIVADEDLLQNLANGVSPRLAPADAEFLAYLSGDEVAVFAVHGQDERLGTLAVALYIVRVRNAVSIVCSWGNGQDSDTPQGLLEESLYYVPLVTDKMIAELPDYTSTPVHAPTPTGLPMPTLTPSKTPVPVGHTAQVRDPNFPVETAVTVLEVRRGEEADSLFDAWCLSELHEQQEVVAVRLRVDYISGLEGKMESFGFLDFGAQYSDGSVPDPFGLYCWKSADDWLRFESYPPGTGEGWLAWQIRKGSPLPYLLYQHYLAGVVDSGLILDPVVLQLE